MELIFRAFHGLMSRARAAAFRARGVSIEGKCWLRAVEIPRQHRAIRIGRDAAIDRGAVLLVSGEPKDAFKIVIGGGCYINRHALIDACERIEIGAECMIGPFCYLTDHDHEFGPSIAPGAGALVSAPTRIENRCWLGAHVTVLKGVTIGAGTVVGAGSVVTKSLPAGVIAAGNPARIIRQISP